MSTHCDCGERLLLTRPGDTCERCRLGRSRQTLAPPVPLPDLRERCETCGALTATADGRCLSCRLTATSDHGPVAPALPTPDPLQLEVPR